ncbi:hypothetical protein KIW84_042009 [Lathyrus oleraceus]|uniref:Uncharacterized protein n=1 Tax=Pisum sativum TaxID=3888 RepID=A0A9D4XA44_PEA|nr:hypothetical protein KIW84_042009 [Pisum sativum]
MNFLPQTNDLMFKTLEHSFIIRFIAGTSVSDLNKHEILGKRLNFKPFADIISGRWNKDFLIDVIELVEKIEYTQMCAGSKKQQVNLILKDLGDLCCEIHELHAKEQRWWSYNYIITVCESEGGREVFIVCFEYIQYHQSGH